MMASACGSLKPIYPLALEIRPSLKKQTSQVEEVRVLMKVVEDSPRSILDVRGSDYRNASVWKFRGKLGPTMRILERGYARRNWISVN